MRLSIASLCAYGVFSCFGQAPTGAEPSLIIAGRIEGKRVTVSASDLAKLPRRSVTVKRDRATSTYEGVPVQSVLELAGAQLGQRLRGDRLLGFALVEGAPPPVASIRNPHRENDDDYRAVFSLAELDSTFTEQPAILATAKDGKPLQASEGPFQIISPQDKRPTRWIRSVMLIWVLHGDYALSQ
jgi:hypothetical protein